MQVHTFADSAAEQSVGADLIGQVLECSVHVNVHGESQQAVDCICGFLAPAWHDLVPMICWFPFGACVFPDTLLLLLMLAEEHLPKQVTRSRGRGGHVQYHSAHCSRWKQVVGSANSPRL